LINSNKDYQEEYTKLKELYDNDVNKTETFNKNNQKIISQLKTKNEEYKSL